jgi:hypothetical protein
MNYLSLFILIGVATILATLYSLRREHIRVEYSVSWLAVGSAILILALFPGILRGIAFELQLDTQLCFLLCGGLLVSVLVFEISRVVSRIRDDNVTLAQRLALLEYQIRSMQRENDPTKH